MMATETYFESWTGFTQFTKLNKRLPESRPDHLSSDNWSGMSKQAQRKEKQQWAIEKPNIDNARTSRGIFLIWKIKEFNETIKKT